MADLSENVKEAGGAEVNLHLEGGGQVLPVQYISNSFRVSSITGTCIDCTYFLSEGAKGVDVDRLRNFAKLITKEQTREISYRCLYEERLH